MGATLSVEASVLDAVRRRDARRIRELTTDGQILPSRISRLITSADLENLPRPPPGIPTPPPLTVGSSLLHEAAATHSPTLQALLECNPPLHKRDTQGLTPLGRAIRIGNLQNVRLLCRAGARPLEKHKVLSDISSSIEEPNESRSHVRYAAANGIPEILAILLQFSQPDDFFKDGTRAIHDAIENGHVNCVKILVEKDLENVQNDIPEDMPEEEWNQMWGRNRLLRAIELFTLRRPIESTTEENNEETSNEGEDENDEAANDDDTEDTADDSDEDDETTGSTPQEQTRVLQLDQPGSGPGAVNNEFEQLMNALREVLSPVSAVVLRGHHGLSLLHYACVKSQPQVLEYLLSIKEFQASINDPNESCKTAIFLAVRSHSYECFDLLVSAGADLFARDMENWTLLHEAVKLGDSGEYFTKQLIEVHGLDVNAVDDDGWTPLHVAARFSSPLAVDILVEHGAEIDAQTDDKETPLLFAASQEKSSEVLKKLLSYRADLMVYEQTPLSPLRLILGRNDSTQLGYLLDHISTLDTSERTRALSVNISNEEDDPLLHFVCRQSNANVVSKLAELVPDVNMTSTEGVTALHVAAFHGKSKNIEALINNGAEPDILRPDGTTAMHLACDRGNSAAVRSLLAGGANPDFAVPGQTNRYYGFTPLMFAARQGSLGATVALIEAGADVNGAKNDGFSALHLAALNRHPKICKALLAGGASANGLNDQGFSPLHIAVKRQSVPLVTQLLISGADPDVSSSRGLVPLHLATAQADTQLVWALIRAKADVNSRTPRLETPVHIAANGERTQASLQILLSNGGKHDLRDVDGDTPLHVACIPGRNAHARILLHRGADPSAVNNLGSTPLHYTAMYGNDRMAELLLDFGANAELRDNNGETPYTLASRRQDARDMMVTIFRRITLTLDDIAPRTEFEIDPGASSGDPPLCVICQHRLVEGDVVRKLQCGHVYHDECIESWLGGDDLSRHNTCPLCQASVLPHGLQPPPPPSSTTTSTSVLPGNSQ